MKTSNAVSMLRSSLQAPFVSEHDSDRQLAAEIVTTWASGAPADAAAALADHPGLRANHSVALDLAYEEYCQRFEAGAPPDTAAFCARFPSLQTSLRRLVDAHQFLEECLPASAMVGAEALLQLQDQFLDFSLQCELGRGAFARVFLARQPALGNRLVALKVSWRGGQEAKTLGRLNHPNIAPVYSVHEDPATGLSAICMPYKGSATLCNVLDRAFADGAYPVSSRVIVDVARDAAEHLKLDVENLDPVPRMARRESYRDGVVRLVIQLAEALQSAHSERIIHRDLKPSNILLTPVGRPLLLDFNLSSDERVKESQFGGTPAYMAPEQLRATDPKSGAKSDDVDARSDLFSLGVILHELLTGQQPFGPIPDGLKPEQWRSYLLDRQSRGEFSCLNVRVDRPLAAIVRRCLALDPNKRFQSAAELAAALRGTLTSPARSKRWLVAHPRVAAAVAVVALGAGFATALPIVVRDPPHMAHYKAGIESYAARDESAALDQLTRAIDASPDKADAWFARGWVYQQQAVQAWVHGESHSTALLKAAWADFAKAEERSSDGRIAFCMGVCDSLLPNHRQAIEEYEHAIERGYAPIELRQNLGFCHLQSGGKDHQAQARDLFNEVLGKNPRVGVAYFNRAWVGFHQLSGSQNAEKVGQAMVADIRQALNWTSSEDATSAYYLDAARVFARGARYDAPALQDAAALARRAIALGENASTVRKSLNDLLKTQLFNDLPDEITAPPPLKYLQVIPAPQGLGIRLETSR